MAPLPDTNAQTITGLHEASAMGGELLAINVNNLQSSDPALYRSLVQDGFGRGAASSGIEHREWALRTVGMLTAMGDAGDQIDVYIKAALLNGATEAEVLSVINQAAQYTGFPRAVNSLRRVQPALEAVRSKPAIQEYTVAVGDHETLVRDTGGEGTPVVLIHALCMDGQMFQKMTPLLAASNGGTRVISYDVRGHGYARGAPLTQSLEQLATDAVMLFDKLGIAQADVVGSSFGGAVAQYLAIMHPDRVRALCPMATGPQGNPELLSRATRALAGDWPALRTEGIIRWFLPETIADNTWCVRYARAKLDHVNVAEWAAAWTAMSKLDALSKGIANLNCPVLVLAGSADPSSTPERMRQIHQAFLNAGKHNSEYVEIPNGTHMMPMDAFEAVADVLGTWRSKVEKVVS